MRKGKRPVRAKKASVKRRRTVSVRAPRPADLRSESWYAGAVSSFSIAATGKPVRSGPVMWVARSSEEHD